MLALGITHAGVDILDLFKRLVMTQRRAGDVQRTRPVDGVDQDTRDMFVIECGIGFMTRTEVENFTQAALIAAAAAENLAATIA